MYDRTPRQLAGTAPSNTTPANLGPGAYETEDGAKGPGYAPFLSLSKREPTFLTVTDQVVVAPGPAHYSPELTGLEKIKGGTGPQNKSRRFSSPATFTPGPGAYTVASSLGTKHKASHTAPVTLRKSRYQDTDDHAHRVSRGRVEYMRKKMAPSIPIPGINYGYEEDENGLLKPQVVPARDSSLGPAYYAVTHEDTATSKKYRGIHFCSLKSQRTLFKGQDGPSPCQYDPKMAPGGASIAPQFADAQLPRYHEIIPQQEGKRGVPGPGKYSLPSQFEVASQNGVFDEIDIPPFGSSEQRFLTDVPQVPSATRYNNPTTAFETLKRVTGMKRSPFGQTASRFKADKKAYTIPGPGSYNNSEITSLAAESKKQSIIVGVRQSVFGTSSVRTVPMTKKDDMKLPGPSDYQKNDTTKNSKKNSSSFASTTKRLYSPPPIVADLPPPGSYDVARSHMATQDRTDIRPATYNSAFQSSNLRFAPPRDILLKETDPSNPSPSTYTPDAHTTVGSDNRGLICSREIRFKPVPKTEFGPGIYELSKSHRNTLLKGTFNVTLNNPLEEDEASTNPQRQPTAVHGTTKPSIIITA